jgi:hypothetical protein
VYSSHLGALGWAQAPGPVWFAYTLLVEPGAYGMPMCGDGAVRASVSVIGHDSEARTESGVRLPATTLCFGPATSPPGQGLGADGAQPSTNATGRINGVKNERFPANEIGCTPGSQYKGKRGAKKDPAWALIGPKGHKTPFWVAGKKLTYGRVVRRPSRGRVHQLAQAFGTAKLYALSGSSVDARTSRALVWADRYFNASKHARKQSKRASARAQAKKQRGLVAKNTRALKRFNKLAKRRGSPACPTGTA